MSEYLECLGGGDVWLGSERVFDPFAIPGYKGDGCRATQQHFVDGLISGQPFQTGPEEYITTVPTVEAAYRCAAEGQPVALRKLTDPRISALPASSPSDA